MAEKKTVIATTEIDLTDYKISKRTNYQNANFSIVFEKKFKSDSEGRKMYEEYEKIIESTKMYSSGGGSMPHLIPVANFKINDIFGMNNGEPISCLGKVNAVYNTTPSQIAFVLEFYDFEGENRKFKNIKVIKEQPLYSKELRKLIK